MAELLKVKVEELEAEIDQRFGKTDSVNSMDLFECFVDCVAKTTNVLGPDDLRGLVFRQFRSYSDYDKSMHEVAQNVSGIQKSTQDAISAIDQNDSSALKSAYDQLKDYQKRISELEESMYTDDLTGVFTRKHLMNRELVDSSKFKTDGLLIEISISNFAQINKDYSHEAGDAVLKFVAKLLQKNLKKVGVNIVRYMGVQFIALCRSELAVKAEQVIDESMHLLTTKTFKTHDGEILTMELNKDMKEYKKGQDFKAVYEHL